MKFFTRDSLIRSAACVAAVAAASVVRLLLAPVLGSEAPFVIHWPAVIFVAWYAGRAAGVSATLLSALLVDYFLFQPSRHLFDVTSTQVTSLISFTVLGTAVSLFVGWLQRTAVHARGQARLSSDRRAKLEQILRAERDALGRAVREVEKRRLAEEALQQSEELYRLLAETVPQLVWMARPDGYVEYLNSRWPEYTGLLREALLGWGWQEVVHADDRAATLAARDEALRSGAP